MKTIMKSKLGRSVIRILSVILSVVLVVQLLGLGDVAYGASPYYFRGYNQENIVTGAGGTFSISSGLSWDGSTLRMGTSPEGVAMGFIAFDEEGHDISSSIDLGTLEVNFSADTTVTEVSDEPYAIIEFCTSNYDSVIDRVEIRKSDINNLAETLSASEPIPAGTRSAIVRLIGTNPGGDNTAAFGNISFRINDSQAPSCSVDYDSDWTNTLPLQVSVSASDGDSGLEGIYINGEKFTSSPKNLDVNANTTLVVYAKDYAGHESEHQTVTITNIDTQTPSAPGGVTLSKEGWTNGDVTVNLPALGTATGAPEYYAYKLHGGDAWQEVPAEGLTVSDSGQYDLSVTVADRAGNRSSAYTNTISIDKLPPVINEISSVVTSGSCAVTADISDAGLSAIAVTKYAAGSHDAAYFTDNGTTFTGGTFTVSVGGTYTVYARDNAGNTVIKECPLNTAPSLVDIVSFAMDEDTTQTVTLNVNDQETLIEDLVVKAESSDTTLIPTVVINQSSTEISLSITPAQNLSSPDPVTITVTVEDALDSVAEDTFTVTVNPVNDAPVAADDPAEGNPAYTVEEDGSVRIDVLANDSDVDTGDVLSIASPGTPAHGTTSVVAGKIRYAPVANYNGDDSFVYTVSDGHGGTDTATVSVTVTPVNDDPTAVADTAATNEDTGTAIDVLANDTDPDAGDTKTLVSATNGSKGTTSADTEHGTVTYTPNENAYGQDTFQYTMRDGSGRTSTGTVTVTIRPVIDPPWFTGVLDDYTINEDDRDFEVSFEIHDVANETPPDSLMLQAVSSNEALLSSKDIVVSGLGDNDPAVKISITPKANKNGQTNITLSLGDGFNTVTKVFTLFVTSQNDLPVANQDTVYFDEGDTELLIDIADLLDNDTDIENGKPTFDGIASQPAAGHGTVEEADADTLRYTPGALIENTSFTYYVWDGTDRVAGTCRILVNALNKAPTLTFTDLTAAAVNEDTVSGEILFTVGDDQTPVADLVISKWSADLTKVKPTGINLIKKDDDGHYALVITPEADANGIVLIHVSVSDGMEYVDKSFVFTINAENDAPVAVDDTVYVPVSGRQTFDAVANDIDVDGDNLITSLDSVSGDYTGTLTYNPANRCFTYAAAEGESGTKTFDYVVSDGTLTDTGTVTMHIEDAKYPPEISTVANQYIYEDTPSGAISFTVTDRDGENTVSVSAASNNATVLPNDPDHIQLTKTGDHTYSLVLAPAADKHGPVTVTITADDGTGLMETRSFTLTVMSVNDAPHATDDEYTVNEDTTISDLDLLENDSDVENDTIWVSAVSAPAFGQITKTGDTYTYRPYRNQYGTETLTYTVTDGKDTATANLTINVTAVNDAPVAWTDYLALPNNTADETGLINVLSNDSDVENDTLKILSFTQGTYGTVTYDEASKKLRYTRTAPGSGANGEDTFTYTIIDRANETDEGCETATGTVRIGIHFESYVDCRDIYKETTEDGASVNISLPFSNPHNVPVAVTIAPTTLGTFSGSGKDWVFTPALDMHGEEVPIRYTVTEQTSSDPETAEDGDSDGLHGIETASANIIMSVHSVNDAPVIATVKGAAVTDGVNTLEVFDEDSDGVSFDVTFGDVDTEDVLKFYTYTYDPSTLAPVALDLDVDFEQETGVAHVTAKPLYANSNGTIKLLLGVSDGIAQDAHVIDVTVTPKDDAPVLEEISRTLYEDTSASAAVITPNTDVDGGTAMTVEITQPTHGVAVFEDGVITYTPDANWFGTDTVNYTVTDQTPEALSSTQTVTFEVLPVNDPLSISGLNYYNTTNEDTLIKVPLTVTNMDDVMSSDTLYTITSSNTGVVKNENITIDCVGQDAETGEYSMEISLEPAPNASGVAYIRLTAVDGRTGEDAQTAETEFRLEVVPVNDAPTADDKAVDVTEHEGVTGTPGTTTVLIDLSGSIGDVEDGIPTITSVTAPGEGRVANNHNSTLTYSVQGDFNGEDTFVYTVMDKNGATDTGTVTVNVIPANDAPLARNDTAATDEDTAVNVPVLTNDTDIDADPLSVSDTSVTTPGAAAEISADGKSVDFTPALNFYGTDTFTYEVSDGHGGTDTATVTVEVSPENDPPTIYKYPDIVWEMDEDDTESFDFMVSDPETTDTSKLIITITSTTTDKLKTEGILLSSELDHKVLTVTPEDNVNESMWVHFDVTDGELHAEADYEIIINAINDAPVMDPKAVTTNEDTSVGGSVTATDIDSETITYSKAGDPAHGTVTVDADGSFTYTPSANYTGADSFDVRVSDGETVNGTSTGTVTVTVLPVNDNPTAVNDAKTIAEDTEIVVDVMANDIEHDIKDGDTLAITAFNGAAHGTLSRVTEAGQPDKIKYKPDANWNGTDTFTYTIEDSEDKSSSATVTITVTPLNDAPSGGDDAVSTNEDNAVNINVTANDDIDETTNPDDEDVTVVADSVSAPSHGTAVLKEDSKTITYTPATDYFGPDSFTYTAKDAGNETAVFTVTVTVNPVNDAPTITDTTDKTIGEDGTTGELTVRASDVDYPDSDLTVTVTRGNTALLPAVTVNNAGAPGTEVEERTFTLTPNANKNGSSLITVTVTDGDKSATDTFTLNVTPENDNPAAAADSATTNENTPILIDVLTNDDIDLQNEGDASLHIESVSGLTLGRGTAEIVTDSGRDKIRFTPDSNMPETSNMTVTFTYTAQDSSGAEHASTATVTVTVTPVNDAPTISAIDDAEIDEDFATDDLAFAVHDEEDSDDALAVTYTCTNTTLFPEGSITFENLLTGNGDRTVKATPVANGYGEADITLTVTDSGSPVKTATETFHVTVNSVNDEPSVDGDDDFTVTEDVPMQLNVLENDDVDYASDHSKVSVTRIVTEPAHGSATVASDGSSITYVTGQDRTDAVLFRYEVRDNVSGTLREFDVSVNVTPVNDAPVIHMTDDANADPLDDPTVPEYTVNEGETKNGIAFTVSDVDNDVSSLILTKRGSNPVLVLASGIVLSGTGTDRTVNVTPNGTWNGTTVVTLTANDGAATASTKFKFVVNSVNEPPTANPDTAEINEDATTKISVLTNDTDPDLLTNSDEIFVDTASCADANLTVSVSSDSKGVDVTPKANYNGGPITVNYTMRDRVGVTSSSTIAVTVKQVNDAPVAVNDTGLSTNEEQALTIDALANDTDIDTDVTLNANPSAEKLSISSVATPTNGTASVQTQDGYDKIVYTPKLNFNGNETFSYTIRDVTGVTRTAQITVTVTQVNDSPVAVTDNVSTNEDTPKVIDPLANDTDVDTQAGLNVSPDSKTTFTITAADVAYPEYGSVTIAGDSKTITYTPVANNHDNNQITYTVSDGHGGSGTGTVNVTVVSVNDPPVISTPANMSLTEDGENGTSAFTVSDVETPAGSLTVQVVSTSNGTLLGTGDVTFSGSDGNRDVIVNPKNNQNDITGTTVRLRVSDGTDTADATFVVTVSPVNDAPTANGTEKTIPEDTVNDAINWTVLTGDVDIATNGDSLSIANVSTPSHGTASYSGNTLYYTPTANYNGDDSFTYTVKDTSNETATATVTMHITQVNDTPVVTGETVSMNEDGSLNIDVLANDTDVDTDTALNHPANEVLTISSIDNHAGAKGTATSVYDAEKGRNVIKFDPDANFNGSVSFDYYVSDGEAAPVKGTVNVTVSQVNDTPVAENDTASVNEGASVDIGVLANDHDVDTDAALNADLHYTSSFTISEDEGDVVFVGETHGSVSVVDNKLHYVASTDNWHGTVQIMYTMKDGHGQEATATVTVTVSAVNDRPVFDTPPEDLTIAEDGSDAFSFTVSDEETEAKDLNVQVASTSDATLVATGDVSIIKGADGERTVTVTPKANQHGGPLTIRLLVEDGDHETNVMPYEFHVTVTPVNDDPEADDTAVATAEETAAVIDVSSLISDNDLATDPGETLTVTVADEDKPSAGTVSVSGNEITYTPAANWNGVVNFEYTVTDASGAWDKGEIDVTVTQVNDAPVAVDDTDIDVTEDTPATIDVLANDSDVDRDGALNATPAGALNVTLSGGGLTAPEHGTVSVVDNKIVYTPAANFNGPDDFEYYVSDGVLQDKGYVSVGVAQVNDNPVAVPDSATTPEDTQVSVNVLTNDTDVDTVAANNLADPHSRSTFAVQSYAFDGTGYGTVSESGGVITYDPDAGFAGVIHINYVLVDGHGGSASGRLTIAVDSENDVPVAVDDTVTTAEDTPVTFNVLENDTDQDYDDELKFMGFLGDSGDTAMNGDITASVDGNGDITFDPKDNYNGTVSIDYIVQDEAETQDVGTITITVTPVNDPPTAGDSSASTNEDTAVDVSVEPLIDDVDGDSLTVTVETAGNPLHGTVTVTDKTIRYTPAANWNGTDHFTYTAADPSGEKDTGVITVTVAQVNDAPVAADDTVATYEDQPVWVSVLDNDLDQDTRAALNAHPEDETLSLSVGDAGLVQPLHGTAEMDGNQVKYTPALNYNGTDSFEYKLSDGDAEDTALVTVTIGQVNDAPVANDDTAVTNDEDMVIISVLSNDTDVDTQSGLNSGQIYSTQDFRVTSVSAPANGKAVISGNKVEYTPAEKFAGTDSFTYVMTDGHGGTDSATVTVTVNSVNDPPAVPVAHAPVEGSRYGGESTVNVTWTGYDIDGDPLTYALEYYDGSAWTLIKAGLTVTSYDFKLPETLQSITSLQFRVSASDAQYTSGFGYSGKLAVDKSVPVNIVVKMTKADGKPYTAGTWTNQSVTVTAVSVEDASAVTFKYAMEDKAFAAEPGKTVVSGVHNVYIQAVDEFGNMSEFGGYLIKIDKQPPAMPKVDVTVTGNEAQLKFTLSADPGGSGNSHIVMPDGTVKSASSDMTWSANKNDTYAMTILDNVGNSTKFNVTVNTLDETPPMIECSTGSYVIGETTLKAITAALIFSDDKADIVSKGYAVTESKTYSGAYQSYTEDVVLSEPGTYYVHAFAKNSFGLTASKTFGPFKIAAQETGAPGPEPTEAAQPVIGDVALSPSDVVQDAVKIRLPDGEWQDSLVLEDIEPGTYLIEVMDENGNVRIVEVTITDEDIAFGQFQPKAGLDWYVYALGGGAAGLLLLFLLLLWRNVKIEAITRKDGGRLRTVRVIRKLRRSRDVLLIDLKPESIKDSTYGTITLSDGLTRRMRTKTLTVTIEGREVFNAVIPDDTKGSFEGTIESWQ